MTTPTFTLGGTAGDVTPIFLFPAGAGKSTSTCIDPNDLTYPLADMVENGILLPHDLYWTDEHDWVPPVSKMDYMVDGSLVIQTTPRLSGRFITLQQPDASMAWVPRRALQVLRTWAATVEQTLTLTFLYAGTGADVSRTFTVRFRTQEKPITSKTVSGFVGYKDDDVFTITLNLMEIPT